MFAATDETKTTEAPSSLLRFGKTFLIIEHDMDFIMGHCNPIIALTQGQVAFQGTPAQAQSNQVLLDAYLGAKENA